MGAGAMIVLFTIVSPAPSAWPLTGSQEVLDELKNKCDVLNPMPAMESQKRG